MRRLAATVTMLLLVVGGGAALAATSSQAVTATNLQCAQDDAAPAACSSRISLIGSSILMGGHLLTVSVPLANMPPAITVTGGRITWPTQTGVTDYKGAWSNGPRSDTSRQTRYLDLGNVTTWTPTSSQLPPCGQSWYYGVASEGPNGEQWSTAEVRMAGPSCSSSMAVGINVGDWGGYSGVGGKTVAQDVATMTQNIRWDSVLSGADLDTYYLGANLKATLDLSGPYNTSGVSALNPTTWANNAVATYQADCPRGTNQCPNVEVLNEPYGSWFWGSNADSQQNAAAYANLIVAAWDAFHNKYGSSSPHILANAFLGCSNGNPVGCSDRWTAWVNQAQPNLASYYDGVIVHAYGGGSGSSHDLSAQGDRNAITSAHNATSKPVYVTEIGWPTDTAGSPTGDSQQWTETQQAANIYNFIGWAKSTGYIAGVWYYAYLDDSAPAWYGLTRHNEGSRDWTHKPGWTGLQQAIQDQPCTVCQ